MMTATEVLFWIIWTAGIWFYLGTLWEREKYKLPMREFWVWLPRQEELRRKVRAQTEDEAIAKIAREHGIKSMPTESQ